MENRELPLFLVRVKVQVWGDAETIPAACYELELKPPAGVNRRPKKTAVKPPEDDFDKTVGDLVEKPNSKPDDSTHHETQ